MRAGVLAGAFLVAGLVSLPLVDPGISHLTALTVVLVAVFAVRFGFLGGAVAGAAGVAVAFVWLLQARAFVAGLPTFGVQTGLFLLIGGLVGSVVSERRRYEVEVTAQDEMSLKLISTTSFEGFFTSLNPAWTDLLGWSLEELLGRPFVEFIHPDDVTGAVPEVVRRTVAGLPVVTFQNRYRCRDGSYRWLEWTSRSDERTKLVYGVAHDITVRKEAEQALASFQVALEAAVRERTTELEERTSELDESRRETLRRLALAAEFRDDETYEHTERVGAMAADLAERLGISTEQTALLRWAAPLHDVGKLALSDSIVLKPGTLTVAETNEVRKHPENGARILAHSNSDVLQLAEQIALNHHEWWDGSGYPHGLAGEDIPLCARIVAVADVYDALTHARPYKRAWPVQEAAAEMSLLRGRQFDPVIVDAFFELSLDGARSAAFPAAILDGFKTGTPGSSERAPGQPARAAGLLRRERETWTHQETDQAAADTDQTQADSHQTDTDADQLASDFAQAQTDREQHASDRDQAAADTELSRDPSARLARALEASRVKRDAATAERDAATVRRDAATVQRDAATVLRDVATVVRDVATGERDAAAERSFASLDELTGVLRRSAGELALIHEIERARRPGRSLVLAVIDVDTPDAVNDSREHPDRASLFRDIPTAITSALRSYDVTVRWRDDEFVCGLSDVTLEAATDRVDEIQRALNARRPRASISAGLAELTDTDTLESLIARADVNLHDTKTNRNAPPEPLEALT